MLRKDFFLAEIQRLQQVLARIVGLRHQDKPEESKKLLVETLSKDFDLQPRHLSGLSDLDFQSYLDTKKYPPQKLDLLAHLLYEDSRTSEDKPKVLATLKKVLLVFDSLERDHHTQSLENISKRSMIEKFIKASTHE